MTKQEKTNKAIEYLKQMDIFQPYIDAMKKDNTVTFFERYAGFWAYQEPELMAKVKELEEKHKCLVYAITHEFFEFGECYSFLVVTDYKEEWDSLLEECDEGFMAFAYVWNVDDDWSSEFGTILLKARFGGILRIN